MYDPKKAHYVVATGIIIKNGKYLITKRAPTEKRWPNRWTVPGGKLEVTDYNTRPYDTDGEQWYNICESVLKREVIEETSLKIKNIRYLTSLAFIRADGIPTLVLSLFADYDSGNVNLCKDLTEYAWVTLKEAKDYDLIEGIYEELEMLDKILKGKKVDSWQNKK